MQSKHLFVNQHDSSKVVRRQSISEEGVELRKVSYKEASYGVPETPSNKIVTPMNQSIEFIPRSRPESNKQVSGQEGVAYQMNQKRFMRHITKVWRSGRNSKPQIDTDAIPQGRRTYERARSADIPPPQISK